MFHSQRLGSCMHGLLVSAVLSLCGVAQAALIVAPIDATATNYYNAQTGPQFSWNGGGLDEGEKAIVETGDPIPAVWPSHANAGNNVHWHNGGSPSLAITYDLGNTYDLVGMHLWNLNQSVDPDRGIRSATIAVSVNGSDFADVTVTGLDLNGYFVRATGLDSYTGEGYNWASTNARYVRFTVQSNWNGDLTYAGLSEVRFLSVPEPVSLSLLSLGGLAMIRRRRDVCSMHTV